ncbi:hypothetical protein EVAR_58904_1 [Eumeta japonica]|uniref:Uncharacterized protein n=1 Tax=Eumeta variegata TaxID=151549 RepID=A0A4C1YWH4_EUMVA|nr:hypothetical protein EVAR_58904_1 [Eumeta japonica]
MPDFLNNSTTYYGCAQKFLSPLCSSLRLRQQRSVLYDLKILYSKTNPRLIISLHPLSAHSPPYQISYFYSKGRQRNGDPSGLRVFMGGGDQRAFGGSRAHLTLGLL